MPDKRTLQAAALMAVFVIISAIIGILLSRKIAVFGLWFMPALYHLYPIATVLFVVIFSVITSRKVLWIPLIILLGIGLLLECASFWLTKFFVFGSIKIMALFVLGLLVLIYGVTWIAYFSIASDSPNTR